MIIAFFDLDGTISKKDTFIDFICFVRGKFYFYIACLRLSPFIVAYFFKFYPNNKLKEKLFKFSFKKFTIEELTEFGEGYAKNRLPQIIYNKANKKLKWHQEQGHKIIILTASSSIWLKYWCEKNNFQLIGTNFQKKSGKYTGKIEGQNCYGINKVKIVKEFLSKYQVETSYGYGNSKSDLPFLNLLTFKNYKPFKD